MLLQSAPALEAYHRPTTIAAANVLADPPMNVFAAKVGEGVARVIADDGADTDNQPLALRLHSKHLADLPDGEYRLGVRASDCTLVDEARSSGAGRDSDGTVARPKRWLRGTIELVEISGSETFVHLRCGGVHFIVHEDGVRRHGLGEQRTHSIDPGRVLVFSGDDAGWLIESYR